MSESAPCKYVRIYCIFQSLNINTTSAFSGYTCISEFYFVFVESHSEFDVLRVNAS